MFVRIPTRLDGRECRRNVRAHVARRGPGETVVMFGSFEISVGIDLRASSPPWRTQKGPRQSGLPLPQTPAVSGRTYIWISRCGDPLLQPNAWADILDRDATSLALVTTQVVPIADANTAYALLIMCEATPQRSRWFVGGGFMSGCGADRDKTRRETNNPRPSLIPQCS